jgi:hypothetical protein
MALGMPMRYPRILSAMPDRAGVYVLGMHRSGTSAAARVIDLLGVPLAAEGMLDPRPLDNPAGYWEPRDLVGLNDELLGRLGGNWYQPPPLELTAYAGHVLRDTIAEARERFRALHPTVQWAWKDPRNCMLLPFWRTALDDRAVVVVAYRHPAEVVASLGGRGIPPERTLRLWEHYLRSALFVSRDLPRIVVDYVDLVERPEPAVRRLAGFLSAEGMDLDGEAGVAKAVASIDPDLRRRRPAEDTVELTEEQGALAARLIEAAAEPVAAG